MRLFLIFAGYECIEDMTDTIWKTEVGVSAEISEKCALF